MNNYISVEVFIENDVSGDWGKEFPDEKHKTKVFCVRGADINDLNIGKIENLPVRYVKEASKDKFLEKGNIIIEISGGSPTQSTGRVTFLENIDREVVCSNFCRALKIKKEYSPKYVFYLLQNIYNSGVFFNFESKTSGIKNLLYNSAFENIKVLNQDYSSQQKIENVITVIDKKIQLLHQINDNLAELAKTIYDYWFVQFDFPDKNGKPYKTSGGKMVYNEVLKREIPEGWEVKSLGEIETNIITGKTPPTKDENNFNGNILFITIDDIRQNLFIYNSERTLSEKGANTQRAKFLKKGDICVSCIGTVGVIGIVGKIAQTNQQINSISNPQNFNKYFLLNYLDRYFKDNFTAKKGAVLDNMNKAEFESIIIINPIQNIKEIYYGKVKFLYEKIDTNIQQIQHLQSLRDWLLPMLMNGQISVE